MNGAGRGYGAGRLGAEASLIGAEEAFCLALSDEGLKKLGEPR